MINIIGALGPGAVTPTTKENGLVIGYGNTHAEAIPGAVSTLAQLVQKAALS
ncbi:hypothetical protein QUF31_19365 [Dickeya chrysanthemi]|uniref:hypothetical protein n=1 Tax=Dickeya TaxID=204037 RepID=UPI000A5F2E2D|nr:MULTISPECIES: hypothetical protein [Dickeya]WJM85234.1 hypothetical protein QUF31_19365 [Dickeya chrysanthemi]